MTFLKDVMVTLKRFLRNSIFSEKNTSVTSRDSHRIFNLNLIISKTQILMTGAGI